MTRREGRLLDRVDIYEMNLIAQYDEEAGREIAMLSRKAEEERRVAEKKEVEVEKKRERLRERREEERARRLKEEVSLLDMIASVSLETTEDESQLVDEHKGRATRVVSLFEMKVISDEASDDKGKKDEDEVEAISTSRVVSLFEMKAISLEISDEVVTTDGEIVTDEEESLIQVMSEQDVIREFIRGKPGSNLSNPREHNLRRRGIMKFKPYNDYYEESIDLESRRSDTCGESRDDNIFIEKSFTESDVDEIMKMDEMSAMIAILSR